MPLSTKQTIVWIALPQRITGPPLARRLRLSVFVSPRIEVTGGGETTFDQLADFPDWPHRVQPNAVTFSVQAEGGPPVPATIVSEPPDPDAWTALFAPTMPVRSHAFDDLTGRPISSYPVDKVHEHLVRSYRNVASTSPVTLPSGPSVASSFPLRNAFRDAAELPPNAPLRDRHAQTGRNLFRFARGADLAANIARAADIAGQLARAQPREFVELVASDGSEEAHFAQLVAFHHRVPVLRRAGVKPPPIDFHQAITALADYPALLVRLGLVVELELPEAGFPQSAGPPSISKKLCVIASFSRALQSEPQSPFTAYILDGDRIFTAAPLPAADQPDFRFGFLNLAKPGRFALAQVDVDGAGLKAINMAAGGDSAPASGAGAAEGGPSDAGGTPAMRSSGISLLWNGHAHTLHARIVEAPPPASALTTLFAEHLVRGYRVDIDDGSRRDDGSPIWRSLHARQGRYRLLAQSQRPVELELDDEGLAQAPITQAIGASGVVDPQSPLYIGESLVRWAGWSLAVRRPGKSISNAPDAHPEDVRDAQPAEGLPMAVEFNVPSGTLPRLRFGKQYRLRARLVDLAGKGYDVADADGLGKIAERMALPREAGMRYLRFEPVPAPALVPRDRFGDGESLHCVVIRSNTGIRAEDYARSSAKDIRFGEFGSCERHVVPPKAPLGLVEAHGCLDASLGHRTGETPEAFKSRCDATYRVAALEDGSLVDDAIVDMATGGLLPIPGSTGFDPASGHEVSQPSVELVQTGTSADAKASPGYAIHHEPQLRLPYLPDPLARGAALFGLPGLRATEAAGVDPQQRLVVGPSLLPEPVIAALRSTCHIPFGTGAWPGFAPFRLKLVEPRPGVDALQWDGTARVLTVALAKAEQAVVRISSYLGQESDVDLLGVWEWMQAQGAGEGLAAGSPGLKQSALAGALWMLTPYRELRLVHAVQQPLAPPQFLFFDQRLRQASSQAIDAAGGAAALPGLVTASDAGRTVALLMGEIRIHGKSTSKLDLRASWKEPADAPPETWATAHANVCEIPVRLPDEAPVEDEIPRAQLAARPGIRYISAADKLQVSFLRHEFGDTRHRIVRYHTVATSRFREYFPAELAQGKPTPLTLEGDAIEVPILSTARPPAPSIRYVIPAFRWQTTSGAGGSQVRTRFGGGLRVYLDPPWYASGEGELLGVVLSIGMPDERLLGYITQWGQDPLWQTGPIESATAATPPGRFRNPVRIDRTTIDAAQAGIGAMVDVAAYGVRFDAERKLWTCDIEIDPAASYFPFVRLALARYQPSAIEGAHLSRIVLADTVQLVPDRRVTVAPVAGTRDSFDVRVEGVTYRSAAWHPTRMLDFEGDQPKELLVPDPPRLIQVHVEKRIPGTSDAAGWKDAGITGIATAAAIAGGDNPGGAPLWAGRVTLPEGHRPGDFRIVVREFQHWVSDEVNFREVQTQPVRPGEVPGDGPPGGHPPGGGAGGPHHPDPKVERVPFRPGRGRLVFADAIEV